MSEKTIPLTMLAEDSGMYRAASKIYPREVNGRFQRLRTAAVFWLLGMFYLFPWLSWDERQAVLFDLPARRFFIFGLQFWPQDFIFLSWLLIIAGLSLFFFTAVAGRLWCGYACPQTVWTEVFIWLERITEGDRGARMKLDAAPWSANKLARKGAKQILWITFALWTGFTFVGFFTPIRELAARALSWELGAWEAFWTLFYGMATYGNAGYLREQVCKYMCPYARFQGAMFDRNTLIAIFRLWRPSLLAGFTGAFASQMWFLAFALETAAKVRTLALIEIPMAQLLSRNLFKQTLASREAVGIALIVGGVILLLNA